jgi:cytochrome c biogenesis factor
VARKVAEITVLAVAAAVPQEAKETVAVTAIVKVAPEAVIAAVALRRGEAAREVVIAAAALAVVLAAADGAAAGAAAEVGMAEVAECARKAVGMRLGHTRTTLCLLCPTMIFSMELVVLEV